MLQEFGLYIILILVILMLVMLAQKIKVAYPVILVMGGLLLSLVPAIPETSINPELIFVIFLPPLLYEAAWYTSWKELWHWRRVIGSFAFLIVIATSLVVAIVANKVIPGFTLALGFLLGSIVSPPDAVSASAVLKYVKAPRRLRAILEGESLLNDASSLIVFRFALIAVGTGQFVFHQAALSFVWVIVAGTGVGLLIAFCYFHLHKRLPTDTNIDIILSLTAPYAMYIVAELLHVSGVLAVVSGGLVLSAKSHLFLSHRSRLRGSNVWSAFGFVLNGLVFMLIGLELPVIVRQLGPVSLQAAIGYGVLITVVLMLARIASTLGASVFTVFISRFIRTADSRPGWKGPLIFGWAGMRGVVSLAAALSVPVTLSNGQAFPQRNLILFITFVVILLTLVIQGLTLPVLVRKVNMEERDLHFSEEDENRKVRRKLSKESLLYLQRHYEKELAENPALQQMQLRFEAEEDLGENFPHEEMFLKVYIELLEQQRQWLRNWNEDLGTNEEVIRKYQQLVDIEEEKLRVRYDRG